MGRQVDDWGVGLETQGWGGGVIVGGDLSNLGQL